MDELRTKARQLLTDGAVKIVIGYGEGTNGRVHPVFIQKKASPPSQFMARENIIPAVQMRKSGGFLIDGRNTGGLRGADIAQSERFPADDNGSFIGPY